MSRKKLSADQMDEILDRAIGQTYAQSVDDERGCGMGRGTGHWMSPKCIVQAIKDALAEFDIDVEDPRPEEEEEEDYE